jgi:hypothetical protein
MSGRNGNNQAFSDHHLALGMAGNRACAFVYCPSVPDYRRAAAIRELLELVSKRIGARGVLERRLDLRTTIDELRSLPLVAADEKRSLRVVQGGVA